MNKYDIKVGDFVVACVHKHLYTGEVVAFSLRGDCVELMDPCGVGDHFYLSDLSEDIDSAISVYAPKSHILIK